MAGFPAPFIKFREDDANGFPLAGGLLYSYAAGTSTPLATYTTDVVTGGSAVPNANPTVLDASGRASVFIPAGTGYKFTLTDSLGNLMWTVDNVQVPTPDAGGGGGGGGGSTSSVPTGTIVAYGGVASPDTTQWLLCDGTSYSIAAYSDLYAVILNVFGGAPPSFNVPDLKGRFPLGKATSGNGSVLGVAGIGGSMDHRHVIGSHFHTINAHTHAVAAHQHSVPFNGWSTTNALPPVAGVLQAGGTGGGSETSASQATATNLTGTNTGGTGTTTDANTVLTGGLQTQPGGLTEQTDGANPPYLPVNYLIKT